MSALPSPIPAASAATARPKARPPLLVMVVLAALVAAPFLTTGYPLFQLTMVMIYAIALLGLNILTGYNGQISLGHGAFFAAGAYTAAILMEHAGWPYWACIPFAGLVCALAGYLFGLPALKLDGLYLALATFALGVATPQLLKFKKLETWTGGVQGISLARPEPPGGLALDGDQWFYVIVLIVTLVLFGLGWNLLHGRIGLALQAVRDQPVAATAMGIHNAQIKTAAFAVSAAYTGIAGALAGMAIQFVGPDSFTMFLSVSLLVGVVTGGLGSMWGAVWGALFIHYVPSMAEKVSKAAPWAIYGLMLILFIRVMPEGLAGAVRQVRAYLLARRTGG